MKTISIGFSKSKGKFKIFSDIIRFVERRDFSHCYVIIDDMVYHAAHGMVHSVSYSNFLKENDEIYVHQIVLTEEALNSGMMFLKDTLGVKYGFDQIFGIFIQKLLSSKEPVVVNNSQRMVCSEFCCRFMEACGLIMPIKPDAITPSDLHEILGNI